jgi:hypothetical protein
MGLQQQMDVEVSDALRSIRNGAPRELSDFFSQFEELYDRKYVLFYFNYIILIISLYILFYTYFSLHFSLFYTHFIISIVSDDQIRSIKRSLWQIGEL